MVVTKVDYTTFTEVDPNSHLALVGADHLDFDAYKNEDCWLVFDYSVGYFGDFEHHVDVKASGFNIDDLGIFWMLSNNIDDAYTLHTSKKTFLAITIEVDEMGYGHIYLKEDYDGTSHRDSYDPITEDTWYYLTITKLGTSLTCKIYSDPTRTASNLIDTLILTLHTNHKFRYLYGGNTFNIGAANFCTLNIENLSIGILPITCDSHTPHYSSGCELLLRYDADKNGIINLDALTQSHSDYENGIITEEEFDFVSDAYINGGINVICPDCFMSCIFPTSHHTSGRGLLIYWDTDKDGILSGPEVAYAISRLNGDSEITIGEVAFIYNCYIDYAGVIDDMCPLVANVAFSANVADATLYVDGEHKGIV